ncbi:MraY family glycosyltransferase [Desulfoplanes formicivorans]|nr:glycosyltransferase family 4 protein [Desulfoplanes formicivorans]
MDVPSSRSSHSCPTPKGGGVGILAAFVLFSLVGSLSRIAVCGATILALISFQGDKQELTPTFRLLVQFTCAFLALWGIECESGLHLSWGARVLLVPAFVIFIVGTANFYNFMDGINGIAGMTGIVGFAGLTWWAFSMGRTDIGTASLALAGGCAGFLPMNVPQARVFMGDIGSVLLGFCFGLFVVGLAESFLDFVVLCSLLFTFYADELCTMLQRFKQGDSFFQPHRKHLYQVLVNEMGTAHWKVSLSYGVVQALIFGMILFLSRYGLFAVCTALILCFGIWVLVDARIKHKAWG